MINFKFLTQNNLLKLKREREREENLEMEKDRQKKEIETCLKTLESTDFYLDLEIKKEIIVFYFWKIEWQHKYNKKYKQRKL